MNDKDLLERVRRRVTPDGLAALYEIEHNATSDPAPDPAKDAGGSGVGGSEKVDA